MTRSHSRPSVTLQLVELLEEARTNRISVDAHTSAGFGAESHNFGRVGGLTLSTDSHGDSMCIARDGGAPAIVLHARDFSLHRYDLSTVRGRAQVREYVRRKLLLLQDAVVRDAEAYVRHKATIAKRVVQQ